MCNLFAIGIFSPVEEDSPGYSYFFPHLRNKALCCNNVEGKKFVQFDGIFVLSLCQWIIVLFFKTEHGVSRCDTVTAAPKGFTNQADAKRRQIRYNWARWTFAGSPHLKSRVRILASRDQSPINLWK